MKNRNLGVPGSRERFRDTKSKTNHFFCSSDQAIKCPLYHTHLSHMYTSSCLNGPHEECGSHIFSWSSPQTLDPLNVPSSSPWSYHCLLHSPKDDSGPLISQRNTVSHLSRLISGLPTSPISRNWMVPSLWFLVTAGSLLFLLACFLQSPGKTASSVAACSSHGSLAGSIQIQGKGLHLWHLGLPDFKLLKFSHLQIGNESQGLTADDIELVSMHELGCVMENELWIKDSQWPSICIWTWVDLWGMRLLKKAKCAWCAGISLQSQNLGARGKQIAVSLKPDWFS